MSRGSWLSKLGTSCSAFARSCSSTICSITFETFAVSYGGSQKAVLRSRTNCDASFVRSAAMLAEPKKAAASLLRRPLVLP